MTKKFIGRSKSIQTKYGKMHKVGISQKDFDENAKNGWLNVLIKFNKEGNAYLEIDDWQPTKTEPANDMPF